jgi:hypothetical protein
MFAVQQREALGAIGDPQAVPALIQALGDSNRDVRRAAAEALVRIGAPAVPALIQALGDSDCAVRRAQRRRWANLAAHWGIATVRMFALRQREALVQDRPALIQALGGSLCCCIATVLFAVRQRRRWANSATPKPCPRSACGRTQAKTPHATRCRRSDTLCLICHKRLRRLPRKARGAY